ncbi:hypothetical protein, partial [Shewanella algae]|uniref:hypothetical protein n=1 Tax=Shewanella algae TaxID=38313 RepID=UPI000B9CFFD6
KEQDRDDSHRVRAAYSTHPFFSVKPFFIWFRASDVFNFTPLKPRLVAALSTLNLNRYLFSFAVSVGAHYREPKLLRKGFFQYFAIFFEAIGLVTR